MKCTCIQQFLLCINKLLTNLVATHLTQYHVNTVICHLHVIYMSHVNLVATLSLYVDVIGETGDVFVV